MVEKTGVLIRPARSGDAGELARLTSQLGYPASPEAMAGRLERILSSPIDRLLVAVESQEVLGWIHGFRIQLLESEFRVEIGGLIVDECRRRHGIGRLLVAALEVWAKEQGVSELGVRCRVEREESHRFYESLGMTLTKTQRVFRKRLG
jgi:GNAT superfamily N-acetyltransferase